MSAIERIIPEKIEDTLLYASHLNRYTWASFYTTDKNVLDIACGNGYGTACLSETAKNVLGLDISKEAIDYANKKYKKNNLKFQVGNAENISAKDGDFEAVVSFETLEHIENNVVFLDEIKRVLKKDGIFLVSVPNDKFWEGAENEYHVREYFLETFRKELEGCFKNVQIYFQPFLTTSVVFKEGEDDISKLAPIIDKNFDIKSDDVPYFLAICSDEKIEDIEATALALSRENPIKTQNLLDELYQIIRDKDLRILELEKLLNQENNNIKEKQKSPVQSYKATAKSVIARKIPGRIKDYVRKMTK